jgi:ankyrin repeat protein
MSSIGNTYLKLLLFILSFGLSARLVSQVAVLDTTNELSNPLTMAEQLDLNNYLLLASSSGQIVVIDWVLRQGADINWKTGENATPIMIAVTNNKVPAVKVLLRYKPDLNTMTIYSETPLLAAVKNGNLEIAELLIRDSADINLADKHGASPLHYASIYGSLDITDMLLYYEAKIDSKTNDGTTPLLSAIWSGYRDIADLLIQKGANCEEKDNQGFTPLMVAAQNGDTIMIELLLKKRVSLYETNDFNYDALDIAIRSDKSGAVKYLLGKGYNWNKKLPNTTNPFSIAVKYSRTDITKILKEYKVPENTPFGFDQVIISASAKFCFHDYYTGFNLAFKEPHLNGGIIAGFDFKPDYTRVLIKVNENTFYQYQDKSYLGYAGVFKEIPLTNRPFRANWSFSSSVVAAYSFGNKLKGSDISPGNVFKVIPSVGFKRAGNSFSVYGNIDYLKTEFYKIGPLWFRLGVSFNMFLDHDRAPLKNIKWY